MPSRIRPVVHIALADLRSRMRSRKLVAILAVVAYLGYLVNVGQIELAYRVETASGAVNVHGTNTAAFVGLKAGLTGATILLFGGFYVMTGTLARDRRHGVDRLLASTTVTDRTYLLGKWLSNVGLGLVVLAVLGVATVVNHLVHGVGVTDPLPLLGPLVVFGLPVAALVGAFALLFESVRWLDGTGGNIVYFFLVSFALASLSAVDGRLPGSIPVWLTAVDTLGQLAVYELTVSALQATVPDFAGGVPSFGTLDASRTFTYTGRPWPAWIFLQRAWLFVPSAVVLLVATVAVDQLGPSTGAARTGWWSRLLARLPTGRDASTTTAPEVDPDPVRSMTFTPVRERDAGGLVRLVAAEGRLTVRGRRWWWYVGAALLVLWPLGSVLPGYPSMEPEFARRLFLPLAFIWPLFLWSDIGHRVARHRMTDLVASSGHAVEQAVAEWVAGVLVGLLLGAGLVVVLVVSGQLGGLLGVAAGAVFGPSLALALGTWVRSTELFELTYLLLWYAGPLNGGEAVDFVGATTGSVARGVPLVFLALSALLLLAGVLRRQRQTA